MMSVRVSEASLHALMLRGSLWRNWHAHRWCFRRFARTEVLAAREARQAPLHRTRREIGIWSVRSSVTAAAAAAAAAAATGATVTSRPMVPPLFRLLHAHAPAATREQALCDLDRSSSRRIPEASRAHPRPTPQARRLVMPGVLIHAQENPQLRAPLPRSDVVRATRDRREPPRLPAERLHDARRVFERLSECRIAIPAEARPAARA